MKKAIAIIILLLFVKNLPAQKKELETYSQKFYKIGEIIYSLKNIPPSKKLPNRWPNALLYSIRMNAIDIKCIFPAKGITNTGSFYHNVPWDISKGFYLNMHSIGENKDIEFYKIFDMARMSEISKITGKSKMSEDIHVEDYYAKTTISHQLTCLWDFNMKRAGIGSGESGGGFWHYDLILRSDETLLMPVAYKDSLYFYTFKDKAWTKPDYQGVEKNKENDNWIRESQVKHPFTTSFRAFQIENDTYFLANADTMLYKYENKQLKEIGRIKKNKEERPVFLVDKDDKKVGFMFVKSIDIIAEERKRFILLEKTNPLYKAIKRIIDEPDRK